ncbi:unnamed protein product [Penicillium olsonii]|nr:unnamed protein product [Penicillium olsonii]
MATISYGGENDGIQVGINHGSIYTAPNKPESRPDPLFIVPIPRDPDFVSRDDLLHRIEQSSVVGSRTVLFGLGGVGKTRLAAEYCHQVRQLSSDTWVFWVHASNAARCEQSLRDIAERSKVPGRKDRNVNIFKLFGNWLQDGNIGKWILVLDNLDDDELLRQPSTTTTTQPPLRYLLESSHGSIIVTTRDRRVALEIASSRKHLVEVQPMSKDEAVDLMRNKMDPAPEKEDLIQLVEELEFMPLAMMQAASYITHLSPRCSPSQYLAKFRESDHRAVELLNEEGHGMYRDYEAKNSIIRTWKISFDHILQIRHTAADLLSLMSFFDRQGIPEYLLRMRDMCSGREDTDGFSEYDNEFESDIATLRDYSFIATDENRTFTMHRLVQLTVRTWLKTHDPDEQWKETFIRNLKDEFPTADCDNWERCRSLFPHLQSAALHQPKSRSWDWATLLLKGSWYAEFYGKFSDAIDLATTCREEIIKLSGADSEETLDTTVRLAHSYRLNGQWREAEQLQAQVLETQRARLGIEHPDTLLSMIDLAITFGDQGRLEEAEQLEAQFLETQRTRLGIDHPDTLDRMSSLAFNFWKQGHLEESEQLETQVLESRRTRLGIDHPDTLDSMSDLAATFRYQGRLEEAEQLEAQVLESRRTRLGINHPDTLDSMSNLAAIFRDQDRLEEAEQLETQVLESRRTRLGAEHPHTVDSMSSLAFNFWQQGHSEEAEQLQVQVLESRRTRLGIDHPDTLDSMRDLAATFRYQGRLEEAEQLETQVLESRRTRLGIDHPGTLDSMSNLATTFWKQGRWGEAEQLEVQVMEARKAKLGVDHLDTLRSMASLAYTWNSMGQHTQAIDLLRECATKRQRVLGSAHPRTISNYETLLKWETEHLHIKPSSRSWRRAARGPWKWFHRFMKRSWLCTRQTTVTSHISSGCALLCFCLNSVSLCYFRLSNVDE